MRFLFLQLCLFLLPVNYLCGQFPDYVSEGMDTSSVRHTSLGGKRTMAEVLNPKGNVMLLAYFKKDSESGTWKKYRNDGSLAISFSFRNGKQHGWQKGYDSTGNLEYKQRYSFDRKYGWYKAYYPSGKLQCKVKYKPVPFEGYTYLVALPQNYSVDPNPPIASAKVGEEICYFPSGKIMARKYFDYGYMREFDWISRPGESVTGRPDGFFQFRDVDVKIGRWLYFNENGKIIRTEDYEKNKLIRSESVN